MIFMIFMHGFGYRVDNGRQGERQSSTQSRTKHHEYTIELAEFVLSNRCVMAYSPDALNVFDECGRGG